VLQIGTLPERVDATIGVAREHMIDVATWQRQRQRQRALSALARLHDVDVAISLARQATAALQEDAALRALSRAERALQDAMELPGAATFYAELQLQLGVTAAHSGMPELADAAFARAASIDPTRRLLAGEAAPDVVSIAQRAFERVAKAREGTLHVAATVTPTAAARVFIDDRELGVAPLSVRVHSGLHVLRVEADGHAPYARSFEMLEGERPVFRVVLSPEPSALALRDVEQAFASGSAREISAASAHVLALEPRLGALLFGERVSARGWFARCEPAACAVVTYANTSGERVLVQRSAAMSRRALDDARAWLTPEPSVVAATRADAPPLWQRWYVWAVAGAAVVGAGVWVGAAAQPDPQRSLRVSVDPSALR
jgi:tetratricopeptide (TPR) repeat protein